MTSASIVNKDTIVAIATPAGNGGVGIVRLSGAAAYTIALTISRRSSLAPRHASYTHFYADDMTVIDSGLVLYFPSPKSFTGEDVVELHGHGGQLVLSLLMRRCVALGAREARPGEFSERAFLNDKLDLVQAEAIADLINAQTESAARQAQASLQGAFSKRIEHIATQLIQLRLYVEAAIDFPEEDVDFLSEGKVTHQLADLLTCAHQLQSTAKQGAIFQQGARVVIAGKPNAGKSSLLNALAGNAVAIVTDQPGTTRDLVREHINIAGVPLHLTDTAGLRKTDDLIEKEGVKRAQQAIDEADVTLFCTDDSDPSEPLVLDQTGRRLQLLTKIDLTGRHPGRCIDTSPDGKKGLPVIAISAQTGVGMDELKSEILACLGVSTSNDTLFSARERHLTALQSTIDILALAQQQFLSSGAGELLAEDLRLAHEQLGSITGTMTSNELLGEIFSRFCIGK